MFPLCSAASCHYHSQILVRSNLQGCFRRESVQRGSSGDSAFFGFSNGTHLQKSWLTQATGSFFTGPGRLTYVENAVDVSPVEAVAADISPVEAVVPDVSPIESLSAETLTENTSRLVDSVESGTTSVEAVAADISPVEALVPGVPPIESLSAETLAERTSRLVDSVESGTTSTVDISPDSSVSLPDTVDLNPGSLPDAKASFDDFSSGVKESFSSSLNEGENAVKNTLDSFASSVTSITKNASKVVDSAYNSVFSTLDQTGDIAGDKFSNFSTGLKEVSNRAAFVAIDLLRQSVSIAENSITNGVSFVVYSYGSAKELLPPDVKSALNSSEDVALKVLRPVGAVLQQAPQEPFDIYRVLYRVWTYGGYAGDLSPKSTLELLTSREKSVLVDIRPNALREKDGIPDLRRTARFRYSSVTIPEVEGGVRRLLKGGNEVEDILTAVIIKNLKSVQDMSKVIVMDADGTRSKGIARALRKVGIKRPYLVQGGFRSWVKEGLRVKELKPETTLTILNEEAEAILEDINPSPLQVVGVSVGFFAALYALFEWEKTLQLIAVIGLGLTIYQRLSSYNDSEDLKQDIRLLLAPMRLGAQAFSWTAGKLETNGVGLPTSPSSSDVRSRVLQAAAKHESQPSDETSESPQDVSSSSEEALEKIDVSEA